MAAYCRGSANIDIGDTDLVCMAGISFNQRFWSKEHGIGCLSSTP
jgi:hypothetical protein